MSETWAWIVIGILAWVIVPLPLALVVGRLIRAGSSLQPKPDAPVEKTPAPVFRRFVIRQSGRSEATTSSSSTRQP